MNVYDQVLLMAKTVEERVRYEDPYTGNVLKLPSKLFRDFTEELDKRNMPKLDDYFGSKVRYISVYGVRIERE